MNTFKLSAGKNRNRVELYYVRLGDDLQLFLLGGEYHIGAIGISDLVHSSGKNHSQIISVPGHKEYLVLEEVMEKLSDRLICNYVITAGIHYDHLTKDELAQIRVNIDTLIDEFLKIYTNHPKQFKS